MSKIIAKNKDAFFHFEIGDTFEAGIVLEGWEVKSIRAGKANLKGAFCYFKNDELFVSNMHIDQYMNVTGDETQARKLLLSRAQLKKIRVITQSKGMTIVPLVLKWGDRGFVKMDITLGRGKSHADKRETIRKRDDERLNAQYIKRL